MRQRRLQGGRIRSGQLLGFALACAALSGGCQGERAKLDANGKSASSEDGNGSSELHPAVDGKIPKDWPEDVAIYPGSKVLMSRSNPNQQVLFLETADSQEAAVEFYKARLTSTKLQVTTNEKQQSMLSYQDAAGRHVMLSIGKPASGGPKTRIALIVNRAKEPVAAAP